MLLFFNTLYANHSTDSDKPLTACVPGQTKLEVGELALDMFELKKSEEKYASPKLLAEMERNAAQAIEWKDFYFTVDEPNLKNEMLKVYGCLPFDCFCTNFLNAQHFIGLLKNINFSTTQIAIFVREYIQKRSIFIRRGKENSKFASVVDLLSRAHESEYSDAANPPKRYPQTYVMSQSPEHYMGTDNDVKEDIESLIPQFKDIFSKHQHVTDILYAFADSWGTIKLVTIYREQLGFDPVPAEK
ncbi:MAG: hypothetical protein H6850_01115 [Alphaproteobacteria bacterium]|nr:MAG: hypothetical protein H6850_01115 [Alphaproteobacteria bacterium]